MKEVWFTADHHFGHKGILKHRSRFSSLVEMHHTLVEAWNSRVKRGDTVYHLGDFLWKEPFDYRCLNGDVVLIIGNHDKRQKVPFPVHNTLQVKVNGQKIWLSHYAHRIWPSSHHGSWHLYGHSHGSLPDDPNALSMDVGVDCHPEFAPFGMEEIQGHMSHKTYRPVDHHGSTGREQA
jgi:calcineurin-like phosphoesterase family protein